jgi:hypothetical protein
MNRLAHVCRVATLHEMEAAGVIACEDCARPSGDHGEGAGMAE